MSQTLSKLNFCFPPAPIPTCSFPVFPISINGTNSDSSQKPRNLCFRLSPLSTSINKSYLLYFPNSIRHAHFSPSQLSPPESRLPYLWSKKPPKPLNQFLCYIPASFSSLLHPFTRVIILKHKPDLPDSRI